MITIKEIARRLDLSTTTVSNVIHGKTGEVSPMTIARVRAFLEEVGYVPNINAVNLAKNKSKIIGLAFKTPGPDPFFLRDPLIASLVAGAEWETRRAGYYLMLCLSEDIPSILSRVCTWNVDGLLLSCMEEGDALQLAQGYRKPLVCLDTPGESLSPWVRLSLDYEGAGREGTELLLSLGHESLAFVPGGRGGSDLLCLAGCQGALEEAGPSGRKLLYFDPPGKEEALEESLTRLVRQEGATALLCASRRVGERVLSCLQGAGISVPGETSVLGLGDLSPEGLSPLPLTCLGQDPFQRGSLATRILIDLLSGGEPEEGQVLLPPQLQEGGSVARRGEKG